MSKSRQAGRRGSGPERRGGFFGGSGLEGFTGVGGGGFGRVGAGGGQGFAGGAGAPEAGGLIGLLQSQQNLRLQQSNIAALRNSVIQLDAFFQADRIDYFQVELARQALLNAQSRWLNASQVYESNLDDFKRDLGLPPWLAMQGRRQLPDSIQSDCSRLGRREQNRLTDLQQTLGEDVLRLSRQENGQILPADDLDVHAATNRDGPRRSPAVADAIARQLGAASAGGHRATAVGDS